MKPWDPTASLFSFRLNAHSIAALQQLPQESFGYCWFEFLEKQQIAFLPQDFRSSFHQTSLHVLTGYGTDPMGMAELYAFLLGTRSNLVSHALHLANLCSSMRDIVTHSCSARRCNVWARLYRAYIRGRCSWFDLRYWQPRTLWDLPLECVQKWFSILA